LLECRLGPCTVTLVSFGDHGVQDLLSFALGPVHGSAYLAATTCNRVSPSLEPELPHAWTLKSETASHEKNHSVENRPRGIYVGFPLLTALPILQKP
jgi:hypothetical protein